MPKRSFIWRLIPFIIFACIAVFLYRGLSLDPHKLPSVIIGKGLPKLELPLLTNQKYKFKAKNMRGKVWLLNVWATWCNECQLEHPMLMELSKLGIAIVGLDYKDDNNQAKQWLKNYGNPYREVLLDQNGNSAIELGVYGAPETFVIDKKGVIRYKYIGQITPAVWSQLLLPIMRKLNT